MKSRLTPGFWIFAATFLVRLVILGRLTLSPAFLPEGGDMKFYSDWALRIAGGEFTDHQAFYGLPGYAFFLAGIFAVVGFSPFIVGLLQAGAEACTALIIYKLARRTLSSEPTLNPDTPDRGLIVGVLAAVGWMFFLPAQTFSVILMPTAWLVLAYWGFVLWAMTTESRSCWRPWLWMGLLIGLVAMMIATVFFSIPLIIAAIFLKVRAGRPMRERAGAMAVAVIMLLAGVGTGASPAWMHNYFIAGEPVGLSAHSGVNFWIGNNPDSNGYPKMPPGMRASQEGMLADSLTMARTEAGRDLTRAEVSRHWSTKAKAYIRENPGQWLRLLAVKFRNFWNMYQYDDLSLITLFRLDGVIFPGLTFGLVSAFALPGLLLGACRFPRARWVVTAVLLHMCALIPVFVTERYRLAAAPGLLLLGALGLHELWRWLFAGKWAHALLYIGGVGAAAFFVSIPQRDPALWSLDPYNTGLKFIEAAGMARSEGDEEAAHRALDRALETLDQSFRFVPHSAETAFALGNLWLEKGDRDRGRAFYHRALTLNPRHASAWNNLGVLAFEARQWREAEKCFLQSVAIEPKSPKTFFLLARTCLEQGEWAHAEAAIREALRQEPARKEFQELRERIVTRRQR